MLEAARIAYEMGAPPAPESGAREKAIQVLRRMQHGDQGHSPPEIPVESEDTYEVLVDMMTAIFEQAERGAPSQGGTPPTGQPPRPTPRGHEADLHDGTGDDASDMDVPAPVMEPPTRISIHIGNLRDRSVPRPWGAEDRRVDRGTPLGNPFPIHEDDLHERNRACDAFEEILRGDPRAPTCRPSPINTACESTDTTRLHPRFENSIKPSISSRRTSPPYQRGNPSA